MILSSLLPVFAIAVLFFVLIIELADISPNLYRYLSSGVAPGVIARIALLYLPTCITYAVPIALLFSVAHTLGSCYARNELIAMFGSGVSLRRLVAPLILFGVLLSGALFRVRRCGSHRHAAQEESVASHRAGHTAATRQLRRDHHERRPSRGVPCRQL